MSETSRSTYPLYYSFIIEAILIPISSASLPSLEDVQGGFNLQTTENFDCSEFDQYESEKVIKGDDYVCKGNEENPKNKDGTPGADGGSGGKNNTKNAGSRVEINTLLGLTVVLIAAAL